REQLGELAPLALVHEISIYALETLDLVHVFETRDARIERIQAFGCGLRESRVGGGAQHGGDSDMRSRAKDGLLHVHCPVTLSTACGRSVSGLPVTGCL